MTRLTAAYIEEIANGRIPAKDSEERKAYEREMLGRQLLVEQIVKESALSVYGSQYYLLGSMI